MTSIDLHPQCNDRAVVPFRPARPLLVARLARAVSALIDAIDLDGSPSQLLRLNDHHLRDVGLERADLEAEALFWPLRRR